MSAPGPNGPVNQSSPTPPHAALQLYFMGLCWPVSCPLILKSIYYLPSVERLFALTGMLRLLGLPCCRLPLFALQATLMAPPPPPPAAGSLTPVRWCPVSDLIKLLYAIQLHNVWLASLWQTCPLLHSCTPAARSSLVSSPRNLTNF